MIGIPTHHFQYIFRGYPQVIHHDSHILEAVEVIVKNNLTCVPVTDRNFKYLGLISLQDAFQALSMSLLLMSRVRFWYSRSTGWIIL